MKILHRGHLSIYGRSPWTPGEWREDMQAVADGSPCASGDLGGFHTLFISDPLIAQLIVFPCEIWEDEVTDECGRDEIKGRYMRQRIVREVTSEHRIICEINALVDAIPSIQWFKPQPAAVPSYMRIERMTFVDAWNAAYAAAYCRNRPATRNIVSAVVWNAVHKANRIGVGHYASWAIREAVLHRAGNVIRDVFGTAAWRLAGYHVEDAAMSAGVDAAWAGLAILASDLQVDPTWLNRWWRAWEIGYFPIRDDGDVLVVAEVKI